jgi:hypothetical protein
MFCHYPVSELQPDLVKELQAHGKWTDDCDKLLCVPGASFVLYEFDRLRNMAAKV